MAGTNEKRPHGPRKNVLTHGEKVQMGQRVKELRKAAGYTRDQFSELCNLEPRSIANIEDGDCGMALATLKRMCSVFSCSADYILFGSKDEETWSDTLRRIERIPVQHKAGVDAAIQGIISLIAHERTLSEKK